ncbi:MAG: hypothetical protein ABL901_19685 [Hyphomicrobiaceae bacterium]
MTRKDNVVTLKPKSSNGTNGERALWAFLMITLVAPFLAALVIFLVSVIAGLIGRGPPSLLALDRAGQLGWAAQKALETYIWSALPAGICGAGMAWIVYTRGTAHWLVGASLGAIVVSVMAVLAGGTMQQHLSAMAFIGAAVGVVMVLALKRMRILL